MKILGCVLIIIACTACGLYKYFTLQKRCKNLLEFKAALETLKTQIGFLKNTLEVSLKNIPCECAVSSLFHSCAESLKQLGIDKAWNKSLKENATSLFFTAEDIKTLEKFSSGLGKTDAKNQMRHLEFISQLTDTRYQNAFLEYNQKGNIYKSGGAAIGIFLVLLLI